MAHPEFILSGVTMNWSEAILSRVAIAFRIQAPVEERLKRIQEREERRFGARVREGGDMFAQQAGFRKMVKERDAGAVEACASRLRCPVAVLDGTLPVAQNLERMIALLRSMGKP